MKFRRAFDMEDDNGKSKSALAKVKKSTNHCKMQLPRQQDDMKKMITESEKAALEMKACLNKLQELVPFAPKNETLSKLEVITSAILYIHDLRETLGLPGCQLMNEVTTSDDFDLNVELEEPREGILDDDCDQEKNTLSPLPSPSSSAILQGNSIPSLTAINLCAEGKSSEEKPVSSSSTVPVVSHFPFTVNSSSLLDQRPNHHHHIKRQPLCMISSPSNTTTGGHGQRVSQKS